MPDQVSKHDQILLTLAMNLQGGTMVQLGKMADPVSGEVICNLDGARYAIDVLEMLQAKCKDNTDNEIVGMLDRMVMDLQLNYMDEIKKERDKPDAASEPAADASDDEPVDGTAAEESSDGADA